MITKDPLDTKLFTAFFLVITLMVNAQNHYNLEFNNSGIVKVKAEFEDASKELFMFVGSSSNLERGQVEFIKNLKVSFEGEPAEVLHAENGRWILSPLKTNSKTGRLKLEYDITLDFDKYTWNSGKEEMAFSFGDEWVFAMRSLLIWPLDKYDKEESVELTFTLPSETKVITPWNLYATSSNKVVVPSFKALHSNTIVIGNQDPKLFEGDGFNYAIVTMGNLNQDIDQIIGVVNHGISYYSTIMGQALKTDYLFVFAEGEVNDGGAFENSFSQVINQGAATVNKSLWAGLCLHELFHLWNGRQITYASEEEEWLLEGLADYYAIKALAYNDLVKKEEILEKLENSIRKYLLSKFITSRDIDLANAGYNKGENRLLIYGGGSIMALLMDVKLLSNSNNTSGLDEILKSIMQKSNLNSVTNAEFKSLLERNSTVVFEEEFENYVYGTEFFPLTELFNNIGLRLDIFGYEDIRLSILEENNALRAILFGF